MTDASKGDTQVPKTKKTEPTSSYADAAPGSGPGLDRCLVPDHAPAPGPAVPDPYLGPDHARQCRGRCPGPGRVPGVP